MAKGAARATAARSQVRACAHACLAHTPLADPRVLLSLGVDLRKSEHRPKMVKKPVPLAVALPMPVAGATVAEAAPLTVPRSQKAVTVVVHVPGAQAGAHVVVCVMHQ